MAQKRTLVKKVVVGVPIRRVTAGSFSIANIGGVTLTGPGTPGIEAYDNDILVWDSDVGDFVNKQTLDWVKVDNLTLDGNTITSNNALVNFDVPTVSFTGDVRSDIAFHQAQLGAFNDSDLTTKKYVDDEVERTKHVIFTTDDGFTDSVAIYDDEDIKVIGGRGLTTTGIKVGTQYRLSINIDSTGVVPGTYGSQSQIPIIRVNEDGQIDSINTTLVAGVQAFDFDSTFVPASDHRARLTISTADGDSFAVGLTLDPFSTADLRESDNLYYTRARFDSALGDSDSRQTIRSYFGTAGDLQYNPVTGTISIDIQQVYTSENFDSDLDAAIANSTNIHWYPDSNYFDLGVKPNMDSGIYGSASLVPVLRVDRYGRVDSISHVSVAGVDSTEWTPFDNTFTIFTADGDSYPTVIDQFGQNVLFEDNVNVVFGDSQGSNDLRISSTGTDGLIKSNRSITVQGGATDAIVVGADTSVELKYQGATKVETDSDVIVHTNLLPSADSTYSLGSMNQRWKDIYLSGQSIYLGSLILRDSNGRLTVADSDGLATVITGREYIFDSGTVTNLTVDSAVIDQLSGRQANFEFIHVDSINVSQITIDSADFRQIDARKSYIRGLRADSANIDSATIGNLASTNITVDSATVNTVAIEDANIRISHTDSATITDAFITNATVDSASFTTIAIATANVAASHTDSATVTNIAIGDANVATADIDSATVSTLAVDTGNFAQTHTDSATITTVAIANANIASSHTDSAHVSTLSVGTGNVDALSVDSAKVTNLAVDVLNFDSGRAGFIQFDNTAWTDGVKPSTLEGAVYYNSGPDALVYKPATASPIKIAQEEVTRVFNNTGAQIDRGTVVYVTGASNDFPTIAKARSNDFNTVEATLGLVKDDIAASTYGLVVNRGLFGGLNTQNFTAGDIVYVSADSAGELVITPPTFPNFAYQIGRVLVADSAGAGDVGGCVQIRQFKEIFDAIRVTSNSRFDNDLTIGGNLNVLGTETRTAVSNLNVADTFIYLGAGDTIGANGTNFTGTGDQNATFVGHFNGDSNETFHIRIDSGGGAGDTIAWSLDGWVTTEPFDSAGGPTTWNLTTDGLIVALKYGISIDFDAATGHVTGDSWQGDASPINVQIGLAGNYNPPGSALPYAHAGLFRDVGDGKWKFFEGYTPEPEGNINTAAPSFSYADLQAKQITGTTIEATTGFVGNVTGTTSDISNHTTSALAEGTNLYFTTQRARQSVSFVDAGGDGSFAYDSGTGVFTYTGPNATEVRAHLVAGTNIAYDSATGVISIPDGPATAGTYGSASQIPVFTIDSRGLVDSIGTVAVAGVSSTSYDSATGVFTINTADGNSFITRFHDSDERVLEIRRHIGASGDITYDQNTGVFSIDVEAIYTQANFDSDFHTAIKDISGDLIPAADSTYDLGDSALRWKDLWLSGNTINLGGTRISSDPADNGIRFHTPGGANVQMKGLDIEIGAHGDKKIHLKRHSTNQTLQVTDDSDNAVKFDLSLNSTTDLAEGTNLYYTDQRVRDQLIGGTGLTYDSAAGRISITDTGVTSGTYGSASLVPVFTVNAQGQIDSIGTVSVAGVSSTAFDSATGVMTINTADGGVFNTTIADSDFTVKRAREAFSAGTGVAIANGVISIEQDVDSTGTFEVDKVLVDKIEVSSDSEGSFFVENNVIARTLNRHDSADRSFVIDIYFRTDFKTSKHRYYTQGSAKGYYLAYDRADLRTSREMEAPFLDLMPGQTYRFWTDDSSMATHDVHLYYDDAKTGMYADSDLVHPRDSDGIVIPAGTAGSYLDVSIDMYTPRNLAYQCHNHPYMGNSLNTNTNAGGRMKGTATGVAIDGTIEGTLDGGEY